MDAKTNSLLLQLKAKKEDELGWFERETRRQLDNLQNEIDQSNQQIEILKQNVQRCIGAMDQAISFYVKYVEMNKSNDSNE